MSNPTYIPDYELHKYDINKFTIVYRIERGFKDIQGQYVEKTESYKNNKERKVYYIKYPYVLKCLEEKKKPSRELVKEIEEAYFVLYTILDEKYFNKKHNSKKSAVANMGLIDILIGNYVKEYSDSEVTLKEKRKMFTCIKNLKFSSAFLARKILEYITSYIEEEKE